MDMWSLSVSLIPPMMMPAGNENTGHYNFLTRESILTLLSVMSENIIMYYSSLRMYDTRMFFLLCKRKITPNDIATVQKI